MSNLHIYTGTGAQKEGGIVEGKLHSECDDNGCGEKYYVDNYSRNTAKNIIEVERDEAVIPDEVFELKDIFRIVGTVSQIASALSVLGKGVNFDKGAIVYNVTKGINIMMPKKESLNTDVAKIESKSYVINRRSMYDNSRYEVEGNASQIASAINSLNGNGKSTTPGARLIIKPADHVKNYESGGEIPVRYSENSHTQTIASHIGSTSTIETVGIDLVIANLNESSEYYNDSHHNNGILKDGGMIDNMPEFKGDENELRSHRKRFILDVLNSDSFYDKKTNELVAGYLVKIDELLLKYTPEHPKTNSFGDNVYFFPDFKMIKRDGISVAYIKYATHFVTQTIEKEGVKLRTIDPSKVDALDYLEQIISNPDNRFVQKNKNNGEYSIIYYLDTGIKKRNIAFVLRLETNKHGKLIGITFMPNKKKVDNNWNELPSTLNNSHISTHFIDMEDDDTVIMGDIHRYENKVNEITLFDGSVNVNKSKNVYSYVEQATRLLKNKFDHDEVYFSFGDLSSTEDNRYFDLEIRFTNSRIFNKKNTTILSKALRDMLIENGDLTAKLIFDSESKITLDKLRNDIVKFASIYQLKSENNTFVVNKKNGVDYSEIIISSSMPIDLLRIMTPQKEDLTALLYEFKKNEITNFAVSKSYSNGESIYVIILGESSIEKAKIRISDHSVTNTNRVMNEIHGIRFMGDIIMRAKKYLKEYNDYLVLNNLVDQKLRDQHIYDITTYFPNLKM